MTTVVVRQPGPQTTVQDCGRLPWQHLGVPVGGAMDLRAHRIANLLVGNDDDAAALEAVFGGIALQFPGPALVALAGRDVTASVDGRAVPAWHALQIPRGALLVVHTGVRTTIAIAGGVQVPRILDGRGTSLRGAFGGWQGRALRRDDILPIGRPSELSTRILTQLTDRGRAVAPWGAGPSLRAPYSSAPVLRFIPGPQFSDLDAASQAIFCRDAFTVAADSDRMGVRLAGPLLQLATAREMLSAGVTAGTVQLPPGGAPIVLMADRQTIGGYPRVADVISSDLPLLAQLRPGESVRFVPTTLHDAHALLRTREHDLALAAEGLAHRVGAR